jgi:hypothetical protein
MAPGDDGGQGRNSPEAVAVATLRTFAKVGGIANHFFINCQLCQADGGIV